MPLFFVPRDNEAYDRFLNDGRGSLPQTFLTIHSKYRMIFRGEKSFRRVIILPYYIPSFSRLFFLLYRYRLRDEIYFYETDL